MMIVRGNRPERDFSIISNSLLRDESLSFRARGVLCAILSFPEGFRVSSDRLSDMGKEGRDAVRSALKELEAAGYIKRQKRQDERGLWSSECVVMDVPERAVGNPAKPRTDFQASENQASENQQPVSRLSDSQAIKKDVNEDKKKIDVCARESKKIDFDGAAFINIEDGQISLWSSAYPAVDVRAELAKAAAWLDANPKNRKSDYKRFLNGWLSRAQDRAPACGASAPQVSYPRRKSSAHNGFSQRDYDKGVNADGTF